MNEIRIDRIEKRIATYLSNALFEILPIRLVLAQKAHEHTRVETRQRHLPDAVAMEGTEFSRGIRRGVVPL